MCYPALQRQWGSNRAPRSDAHVIHRTARVSPFRALRSTSRASAWGMTDQSTRVATACTQSLPPMTMGSGRGGPCGSMPPSWPQIRSSQWKT